MSLIVAVLSDTHIWKISRGKLRGSQSVSRQAYLEKAFPYLERADLILHAGDIVEATVLEELAAYARVRAVRGDHDSDPSVTDLPKTLEFEFGGVSVAMTHDSGRREGRRRRLRRRFPDARVIIFGHSHMPGLEDEDGLLLLNPGSLTSGPVFGSRQLDHTFALLYVEENDVYGEIVDLKNETRHSAGDYPPLSTKRPKEANFGAATRKLLLKRADHKCQICSSEGSLRVAHIVPVSEGGKGTPENGQVLCHRCHVEKTSKARRQKELNEYLEREPNRIIPNHKIDWTFDALTWQDASLPARREELYGLTVEHLIAKLKEREADYLALDLVRGYLSSAHDKYYGIDRWGEKSYNP